MQIENDVQETAQHLFTDEDLHQYTEASTGQRFLNWLIDNLLMQYGLSIVTGHAIGYILAYTAPEFLLSLSMDPDGFDVVLLGVLIAYFNYIVYYTFCEKVFRGYTLGKLVTGTRALRTDGKELTLKNALLRSLSRMVPFEAFSGFGYPWHDRWTNTMVIKSR